jgi:hypothetical protein
MMRLRDLVSSRFEPDPIEHGRIARIRPEVGHLRAQPDLGKSGVKVLQMRRPGLVRAYDLSTFGSSATLCDALALEPPGYGAVAYVCNDNDQFGQTDSNTRGVRANGKVDLDGTTYRVHLRANFQWVTNRPESFKVLLYDGRIF